MQVDALDPKTALLYSEIILWVHWCIVMMVVMPVPLFLIGGIKQWNWVRYGWVRIGHLALVGFIVANTLLGNLCPLTVWETALRERAGQAGYDSDGFIADWVRERLYVHASKSAFAITYASFGIAVLLLLWRYPPIVKSKRVNGTK